MKKTIIASLLLACICGVAFAQQSDNRIQLVRNATLKIHYAGPWMPSTIARQRAKSCETKPGITGRI